MASTFKFHSSVNEVVPFTATYEFPTQATRVNKSIVKLPAKNGGDFTAGKRILIEFPADNYLNPLNSYFLFDCYFTSDGEDVQNLQWQRGGAQNVIKRLRIMYGSLVIEDIQEYKTLVRIFQECAIPQDFRHSLGNVLEGMSANLDMDDPANAFKSIGESYGNGDAVLSASAISLTANSDGVVGDVDFAKMPAGYLVKLSDQASIEDDAYSNMRLTISAGDGAGQSRMIRKYYGARRLIVLDYPITTGVGEKTNSVVIHSMITMPSSNVAADVMGYDPGFKVSEKRSYALNLMSGLLSSKKLLPLKWMASQLTIEITLAAVDDCTIYSSASNHRPVYHIENPTFVAEMMEFDSTYDQAFYMGLQQGVPIKFSSWHHHSFNVTGQTTMLQIHERSRSVKAAYAVVRDTAGLSGLKDSDRFFHAIGQTYTSDGTIAVGTRKRGAIEEFQWRVGGRYYPSQPIRATYGAPEAMVELSKAIGYFGNYTVANAITQYNWSTHGTGWGDKFIMCCQFENKDVMNGSIAGINGEEQSDIALTFRSADSVSNPQKVVDVFMHFDALLIIREGNMVSLIA